jgi:hypothetical protein
VSIEEVVQFPFWLQLLPAEPYQDYAKPCEKRKK